MTATGKSITKNAKTYCDLASQNVWNMKPPMKMRGIISASSKCSFYDAKTNTLYLENATVTGYS